MAEEWVRSAGGEFRMVAEDDLERYRADSMRSKEPETIAWINHHADGGVFYDVGANIGIYSLYAASRNPDLRVFAFEPYYRNQYHLVQNVLGNGLANVVPVAAALADRPGVLDLFVPDDRFGASGAQIGRAVDEAGTAFEPLEQVGTLVLTVDVLVGALGLPVPTFVKIDVDGAERSILEGMAETLRDAALRSVLVEVNLSRSEVESVDGLLGAAGLERDTRFNDLEEHSRHRRAANGRPIENVVYSR